MKKAKLFRNGQSQAVRLPREFRFEGDEVYVKKTGEVVLLIPVKHYWDSLVKSLEMFLQISCLSVDNKFSHKSESKCSDAVSARHQHLHCHYQSEVGRAVEPLAPNRAWPSCCIGNHSSRTPLWSNEKPS
jgi:antitoxin VapB